jgi:hypothetical protein
MKKIPYFITIGILVAAWSICGTMVLLSLPGWMDQLVVHSHFPYLMVFAILTILCAPLGYLLLTHLTVISYKNLSKTSTNIWISISFLVGALLVFLIPLTFPIYPTVHQLDIHLASLKDSSTGSGQLFIESVEQVKNNFQRVDLKGFSLIGNWEKQPHFIDGSFEPLSTSSSAALFSWQGETSSAIEVVLRAGPESSPVIVSWDGQEQTLDLNSEIGRDYPLDFPISSPIPKWLETILLLITSGIGFGFVIFTITTWLVLRGNPRIGKVATHRWQWMLYSIPCLLTGFIYLLTFWPGVMNIDSIVQWTQVLTGKYSDAHPVFHTFLIWLVTRIWLSPAAISITQVLAFSITAGWGFSLLERMGLPQKIVWAFAIIFALFPPNGLMMVTLWKDVPYSICILGLTMMMINFLFINRSWITKWRNLVLLACVSALVALFRVNGVVVALGTLFFLWLGSRDYRRYLIIVLALSIAIWLGVRTTLNLFLHPTSGLSIESPLLHPVAAHLSAGTSLSVSELNFLQNLHPVENYIPYICYSGERTAWSLPDTNNQEPDNPLVKQPGRLSSILISLTLRNPLVSFSHFMCKSSSEWQISTSGNYETFGVFSGAGGKIFWLDEHAVDVSITAGSKLPWLVNFLTVLIYAPYLLISSAIYRPAIYLYGLLTGISIAILRSRSYKYWLLAVPILLNSISLVFAARVGAFRYSYPTLLISMALTGFLMFYTRKPNQIE